MPGFAQILRWLWRSSLPFVVVLLMIVALLLAGDMIARMRLADSLNTSSSTQPATATTQPQTAPAADQVYTCSMHPSVRLPDADAKCPICHMDLIPVGKDEGGKNAERRLTMTPAAMKLAEIQTAEVGRMYPTRTVRLFGRLDFDETRLATISAYFPGRIERLFVDYTGVPVRKGEHLAQMYSPELIAAQEELQQAASTLEQLSDTSEMVRQSARATLEATREKLRLWGVRPEQIREMETAETIRERLTIYSPITGVVIHKNALEGAYVKTGEPIYKVADLSHLWLQLEAYESQLPWIRYGQQVEFTVDSMPGETFTGRISFIDPIVGSARRTVRVRVNVDNSDGRLKPGMFARAVVHSRIAGYGKVISADLAGKWICPMHPEVIKDGQASCDLCGMPLEPIKEQGYVTVGLDERPPLVIPSTAPMITGKRAVVYVRVPDAEKPTFEGREVVLGPRAGDLYIVKDGLTEGEHVVVHGTFKIDSAMQIAAKPSMMTPPDADKVKTGDVEQFDTPDAFLYSLKPVYSMYFDAQEALADDDLDRFKRAARDLQTVLELVKTTALVGEPLGYWRRYARELQTSNATIDGINSLETARAMFETWSDTMIEIARRYGHYGQTTHYVQYCPMAFDDRGAFWLARTEQINNPYFGESMLRCGEVRETHQSLDVMTEGGADNE